MSLFPDCLHFRLDGIGLVGSQEAVTEQMEWHQSPGNHGNHVSDVFDTIPLIPFQSFSTSPSSPINKEPPTSCDVFALMYCMHRQTTVCVCMQFSFLGSRGRHALS